MAEVPWGESPYIFGLHEPGGEHLMVNAGRPGWLVFTHALGHDPTHTGGYNYRPWADQGLGVIARLNNGYGTQGTIPLPAYYDAFAQRVANWVAASEGCRIWVIGNETNHGQERPEDTPILPAEYADCYARCWRAIHALPGHQGDQVVVAPPAPWNAQTKYPGNPDGDWVLYWLDVLDELLWLDVSPDALALHTYTHGGDPELVYNPVKMGAPFGMYHYHFRCYRDFLEALPPSYHGLPLYVTETDQDVPWVDENRGWVQNAYREIDAWNRAGDGPTVRALVLYRWPPYDKWFIEGKQGVIADFQQALAHDYRWTEAEENPPEEEPVTNLVQNPGFEGAFTNRGAPELDVAEHWEIGWLEGDGRKRPEWKPERAGVASARVRSGQYAQKWFSTHAPHDAWMFQVVEGLDVGKLYRATAHVFVWSSSEDDPNTAVRPGKVWVRLGANPWGVGNAYELSTEWGACYVDQYLKWIELECIFRAQSTKAAIVLHSVAEFGAKHNDAYWDDAALAPFEEQTPPEPEPPPEGDVTLEAIGTLLADQTADLEGSLAAALAAYKAQVLEGVEGLTAAQTQVLAKGIKAALVEQTEALREAFREELEKLRWVVVYNDDGDEV